MNPVRNRTAVVRLAVSGFRSYAHAELGLDGRPVVLVGVNGVGKTNLLEALSFLAPGRGLRNASLDQLARFGADGRDATWAVSARIETPDGLIDVGTGADPEGSHRRVVRIDGVPVSGPTALSRVIRIGWLTPAMDRLFVEGGSERRRFLDRLVFTFEPDHAQRASHYTKAMRERNRVLRAGRVDPTWLRALEAAMSESGVALAVARAEIVARLNLALGRQTGPFPSAVLRLFGELDDWVARGPALDVEERLKTRLAENRERDREVGRALDGPHRSDLRVHHPGKGGMDAELCSTGEQKALLISIVLASARLQAAEHPAGPPVLLLDEVTAHLDAERRGALFDALCELGCQAWLTGTDIGLFAPFRSRAQHFEIGAGEVVPLAA